MLNYTVTVFETSIIDYIPCWLWRLVVWTWTNWWWWWWWWWWWRWYCKDIPFRCVALCACDQLRMCVWGILTWRHRNTRCQSCRKESKIWADTAADWRARSGRLRQRRKESLFHNSIICLHIFSYQTPTWSCVCMCVCSPAYYKLQWEGCAL